MLRARNRFVQGYNAQAAVSKDQVIVAAEVTNAANDSTMFAPMVTATEENLARSGAGEVATFVADTGYWSVPNATIETTAEVLITPMPATNGITDPNDPRIATRDAVLDRLEAGELSAKEAAALMGTSDVWARQLLKDRRSGRADPAVLRKQMLDRLEYSRRSLHLRVAQDHHRTRLRQHQGQSPPPTVLRSRDESGTERMAAHLHRPQPLEGEKAPAGGDIGQRGGAGSPSGTSRRSIGSCRWRAANQPCDSLFRALFLRRCSGNFPCR